MKAELVEKLILAHCSGEEKRFADAVSSLAGDELKKGNVAIASRIRRFRGVRNVFSIIH